MDLSPFEALMLLCFGVSWPFSIHKSWTTRQVGSKSLGFLILVLIGYAAGIAHKVVFDLDPVVALYALNFAMVAIDTGLYVRNRRLSQSRGETPTFLRKT